MKRVIIVEILLILMLGTILAIAILLWNNVSQMIQYISTMNEVDIVDQSQYNSELNALYENLYRYLPYGILALVAALCDLAVMVLVAIHNFPCFKPLIDKLAAKRAARKEATATAKAERAEADKQARIERLTAELNELKKDE